MRDDFAAIEQEQVGVWYRDGNLLYCLKEADARWIGGRPVLQNATTASINGDEAESLLPWLLEQLNEASKVMARRAVGEQG